MKFCPKCGTELLIENFCHECVIFLDRDSHVNSSSDPDFIVENGVLLKYVGNGSRVVVPYGVKVIGERSLSRCEHITSITLPSTVVKIEKCAFSGSKGLISVTLPPYITEIPDDAFNSCQSLQNVNIPQGVRRIGKYAFLGCNSISYLEIPSSVEEIDQYALKIRNRMTIKLPEDLAWHCFKEEYELNRDDWNIIAY